MSCTAIMLDWARPKNVSRITDAWERSRFVSSGIVLSNKPCVPKSEHGEVRMSCSTDLGLTSRFMPAVMATTDAILIQDDDILLPDETVGMLLQFLEKEPNSLHGIFGRNPKADGSYARILDKVEAEVDVVLTRVLVCTRRLCLDFFYSREEFPLLDSGVPTGNGEDIVFSYVAMSKSKKKNKVHRGSVHELENSGAICNRPGHWARRTEVMQFCRKWINDRG